MDALITALNERIAAQVAKGQPRPDAGAPGKNFADILDSTRSEMMLKTLDETIGREKGPDYKVLSAENVEINRVDFDAETRTDFDPKQKLLDLFGGLNEDMISLDASIEVLADPNVKLNRRQLLAYQAGIGNMTINTELFSKLAQSVSQNVSTLLNTNVG